MPNLHSISAAIAVLGCVAASSALAQYNGFDNSSNWTSGGSTYVMPSINAIDSDNKFGANQNGEGVGLRIGKAVSPNWDLQFGATFSRQNNGTTRYRQNTLGLDGLYLFSRDRLRPFLLLGIGAEYDQQRTAGTRAKATSGYLSAGAGVQYSFTDQWGMQVDYRRSHAYLRGNDFAFNRANTNTVTVALTYALEKSSMRVPVAQTMPAAPAPMTPVAVAAPAPAPVVAVAPAAAAAPAPAPAPMMVAVVVPAPQYERYTLSATELFAFDSAELHMPQPRLDEIATALNGNAQVSNVMIIGYTDRLGSENYNMELSQRRADAVKGYLGNKGVAGTRMVAEGKGEAQPVVQCSDTKRSDLIQCLEPNRRVEVGQIVIDRRTN